MKTFRATAFLVAIVMGICNLNAGTLFWQVSNNLYESDYASVVAVNESNSGTAVGTRTYLSLLDGPGGEDIGSVVTVADAMANVQYADVDGYSSGYAFYIELMKYDETSGGYKTSAISERYEYSDISRYVSSGPMSVGSVNAWTASVNVPEPTSGLLLLVGGSLLALRRKRRA